MPGPTVPDADHYPILREMPALAGVPDRVVWWVASNVDPIFFGRGEHLIVEGGADRDCYFIVSGETAITVGGEVRGRTGAGEAQGEVALLFKRRRIATTTALTDVHVLRLPAERWDLLVEEDPAAAGALAEGIVARLRARFGS
jgi:CRP-like cAMP-binding protein